MKAEYKGFDEALNDIYQEIQTLTEYPAKTHKKVLRKCGKVYKSKVILNVHRTNIEHTHIADDVTVKIKTSTANGEKTPYVTVKGGKDTKYKWEWVNSGHLVANSNGNTTMTEATHFVDNAEKDAESEVEQIIEEYIQEILNAKEGEMVDADTD